MSNDNIIHVNFGQSRIDADFISGEISKLRAAPWNLSESNATLLAHALADCARAFAEVGKADISWKRDDPAELVGVQLNAFAAKCRDAAFNQITKAFYTALAYGTSEQPRGQP